MGNPDPLLPILLEDAHPLRCRCVGGIIDRFGRCYYVRKDKHTMGLGMLDVCECIIGHVQMGNKVELLRFVSSTVRVD